jgi:hypothetical protein
MNSVAAAGCWEFSITADQLARGRVTLADEGPLAVKRAQPIVIQANGIPTSTSGCRPCASSTGIGAEWWWCGVP